MLEKMWRNRNTFTMLVGVLITATIVEDSVAIPQGPRNRNFIWPSNPITGIYPKDYKSSYYKDTCTCKFIVALWTIAKTWNQPNCSSMIDWTRKIWHIYTMEYYATIKCHEFGSFVGTWMNLETIILSKLTQEQKTKHYMFSLVSGSWTVWETSHTRACWGLWGIRKESVRWNT